MKAKVIILAHGSYRTHEDVELVACPNKGDYIQISPGGLSYEVVRVTIRKDDILIHTEGTLYF